MIQIAVDVEQFRRQMTEIERNQLPFAAMKALNQTAIDAQTAIRSNLPRGFTLRRKDFVERTIKIDRSGFATKTNLTATLGVDPTRDFLAKFEAGGPRTPRAGGKSLLIPIEVRRNKSDIVPKSERPKAFAFQTAASSIASRTSIYKGNKRTFMIQYADGRGVILRRVGRGKGSKLVKLYRLKPRVQLSPRLDFIPITRRVVSERWAINFTEAFEKALASAR